MTCIDPSGWRDDKSALSLWSPCPLDLSPTGSIEGRRLFSGQDHADDQPNSSSSLRLVPVTFERGNRYHAHRTNTTPFVLWPNVKHSTAVAVGQSGPPHDADRRDHLRHRRWDPHPPPCSVVHGGGAQPQTPILVRRLKQETGLSWKPREGEDVGTFVEGPHRSQRCAHRLIRRDLSSTHANGDIFVRTYQTPGSGRRYAGLRRLD